MSKFVLIQCLLSASSAASARPGTLGCKTTRQHVPPVAHCIAPRRRKRHMKLSAAHSHDSFTLHLVRWLAAQANALRRESR